MSAAPFNFGTVMKPVAEALLDAPNRRLSNPQTWRYGRKGSLVVHVANQRAGTWHDFETGEGGGVVDLVSRTLNLRSADAYRWLAARFGRAQEGALPHPASRERPPAAHTPPDRARLEAIWRRTQPITAEDPAGRYLLARGCRLPPPAGDLRWLPRTLQWKTGHVGPALVGLITDARDANRRLSLHYTWIAGDGSDRKAFDHLPKASRPEARLFLKGYKTGGGVIRLCPDDEVTLGLAIGEGIETCLTLARAFASVWSCLDAGHLKSFPVLAGIESLTVAVDHDRAGLGAWDAISTRWLAAGREVRKILAPIAGADLNDWGRSIDRC